MTNVFAIPHQENGAAPGPQPAGRAQFEQAGHEQVVFCQDHRSGLKAIIGIYSTALGPALGGLLNASFGNAAELIIALFALARGPQMYPLVKASLTGSIIGNVLLVLGASIVAGAA